MTLKKLKEWILIIGQLAFCLGVFGFMFWSFDYWTLVSCAWEVFRQHY